mmetsp:Transcript_61054/g.137814  ORF Transcript_61054/g.137814 Transcript_61054/m.137814 type:complete len:216 (-) Transcript_61054:759-1406(-)
MEAGSKAVGCALVDELVAASATALVEVVACCSDAVAATVTLWVASVAGSSMAVEEPRVWSAGAPVVASKGLPSVATGVVYRSSFDVLVMAVAVGCAVEVTAPTTPSVEAWVAMSALGVVAAGAFSAVVTCAQAYAVVDGVMKVVPGVSRRVSSRTSSSNGVDIAMVAVRAAVDVSTRSGSVTSGVTVTAAVAVSSLSGSVTFGRTVSWTVMAGGA